MRRTQNSKFKLLLLSCAAGLTLFLLLSSVALPQTTASNEAQQIISFLNQTIVWYRQLAGQQQIANQPNDILSFNQNRQLGDEAVRLSFEFARARAQALPGAVTADQPSPNDNDTSSTSSTSSTSRYQNLINAAAKSDALVRQQQQLIVSLKQQLAAASSNKERARLQSQIADEESELALDQARADTLHSLIDFTAVAKAKGLKSGGLLAQVEELARTVPAVALESKQPAGSTASSGASVAAAPAIAAAPQPKSEGSGLFALGSSVLALRGKVRTLDEGLQLTDSVANLSQTLRAPLVKDLRDLTQRGDVLTSLPDSTDPAVEAQHRSQVDALTAEYKRLAASVLPLGKQALLLDLYKRNLSAWRVSAQGQYASAL